jgi:hypothetical protein
MRISARSALGAAVVVALGCGSKTNDVAGDSGATDGQACKTGAECAAPADSAVDAQDSAAPRITGSGGTLDTLIFGIAGDTRPPYEDDTSGYPTAVIQKIFEDIQGASPPFVVSTGDYQYASPNGSESAPQLNDYLGARAKYSGVVFPAMGNHECTGYTSSNCGPNGTDGETPNYKNFLSMMLAPIGQTNPYYSINIKSTAPGGWTSKFVFIAANAWDSTQSSWLSSTLAMPTTYTFVIRHESSEADTAPGVSPSDTIIAANSVTLEIFGHTHSYEWYGTNQIIMGNGGAPLSGGVDYGYGLVRQQPNGNITVDEYDYQTQKADPSFHRELTPAGQIAG